MIDMVFGFRILVVVQVINNLLKRVTLSYSL